MEGCYPQLLVVLQIEYVVKISSDSAAVLEQTETLKSKSKPTMCSKEVSFLLIRRKRASLKF